MACRQQTAISENILDKGALAPNILVDCARIRFW